MALGEGRLLLDRARGRQVKSPPAPGNASIASVHPSRFGHFAPDLFVFGLHLRWCLLLQTMTLDGRS